MLKFRKDNSKTLPIDKIAHFFENHSSLQHRRLMHQLNTQMYNQFYTRAVLPIRHMIADQINSQLQEQLIRFINPKILSQYSNIRG